MRFSGILNRLFALGAAMFALCAAPAQAQVQVQVNALAQYVVNIAGINVAYVNVRLEVEGSAYQLDIAADVAGLAQMVAQGAGSANSGGVLTNTGLASTRFYLETRTAEDRFSVQAQYAGGNTTSFAVNPPPVDAVARVPVQASHRNGVNDPVAPFILRGAALSPELCNRSAAVFTGIERFDLAFRFAEMQEATSLRTGYQGPVVLCQMTYRPVSGHFTDSEVTRYLANESRMLVWFAPLGQTGFFIPYRMLISTSFGDISMVLTHLE